MRRVPCNFVACDEVIRTPWEVGVNWKEQPRFKSVDDCCCSSVVEGDSRNKWHFADLVAGPGDDCSDEAAVKSAVLRNVTSSVFTQIKQGNLGACATADKKAKEGCCLVQWVGEAHIDQAAVSAAAENRRSVLTCVLSGSDRPTSLCGALALSL